MKKGTSQSTLNHQQILWLEVFVIVILAFIPLFTSFPYRINIFLTWEGAYRLYVGQVPFKDFGLPMGYGFWVIPAFFFKIFGPFLITLIKAQVFINIISGLAFRSILKSFKINPGLRLVSVLLFCISYSLFNFWPWYNHTVIVFELIGISFLLKFILGVNTPIIRLVYLILSTFFLFASFFTKQDGGGLAFMLAFCMVVYHAIIDKKLVDVGWFLVSFAAIALLFILPLLEYDFRYWFNLGQEPHNSRIQLWDFVTVGLSESKWEKFYIGILIIVFFTKLDDFVSFYRDKEDFLFYLFTLGILVQAMIFQVTSYTPPDNNIFFHSFAFAYVLSLTKYSRRLIHLPHLLTLSALVLFWWSGTYWKYVDRKIIRLFPTIIQVDEDKISRSTYVLNKNEDDINMAQWTFSDVEVFQNIYMPEPTVKGIDRLLAMDIIQHENIKVLNMTELTPLAHEIGYELEKNKPLWYHKGVGIFQRDIDLYVNEIEQGKYDIVLFEVIPYLNNFYPEEVREALQQHYRLHDRFLAPRRPTNSHIEVYIKPSVNNKAE